MHIGTALLFTATTRRLTGPRRRAPPFDAKLAYGDVARGSKPSATALGRPLPVHTDPRIECRRRLMPVRSRFIDSSDRPPSLPLGRACTAKGSLDGLLEGFRCTAAYPLRAQWRIPRPPSRTPCSLCGPAHEGGRRCVPLQLLRCRQFHHAGAPPQGPADDESIGPAALGFYARAL